MPGKFDVEAVKSVAYMLLHRLSGPETATVSEKAAAPPDRSTSAAVGKSVVQADSNMPKAPPGVDIDANIADTLKQRGNPIWFYNQVKNKGPWDYKQQAKQFQDFGNFHYGATGAAMGFTEATLLRMAGWAHAHGGNVDPGFGKSQNALSAFLGVGGKAPFGDDPADQYWISRGYQYYHQKKKRWEDPPPPPSKLRGGRKPKRERED